VQNTDNVIVIKARRITAMPPNKLAAAASHDFH